MDIAKPLNACITTFIINPHGDYKMRVALIHDWLTGMRGGEKCLEVLCGIYPSADIFTLLHMKGSASKLIEQKKITASFIQKLPFSGKYRYYLPLFPCAIETFDLTGYDLVISVNHCVAKGVITGPGTTHICYCLTPMRYVWDMYHSYFGAASGGFVSRKLAPFFANYLRMWDVSSSRRVDNYIAISDYIAKRISKYYGRKSEIVYPPVDCSAFTVSECVDDYYLIVSAFAPYKRVDLAIEAFNRLGLPLMIIGKGQDEERLKEIASSNVRFLGWQSDETIRRYYSRCKALIFPGEEDFGIVPLEAQASGRPVIAFGQGGVCETVVPANPRNEDRSDRGEHKTGVFFYEQDIESIVNAVKEFEEVADSFEGDEIRRHALQFDKPVFREKLQGCIEKLYSGRVIK